MKSTELSSKGESLEKSKLFVLALLLSCQNVAPRRTTSERVVAVVGETVKRKKRKGEKRWRQNSCLVFTLSKLLHTSLLSLVFPIF